MVRAEEGQQQGNLTLSSGGTWYSKWRLLNHLVITRARHSPLNFFCAGLVFMGFCFHAWGCVQGEGKNDVVDLDLLVRKLHITAGSGALSRNQFQCPIFTGDVILSLVVY